MMLYGTRSSGNVVDCSKTDVESEIKRLQDIAMVRDGNEPEFLQAFNEVVDSLRPMLTKEPKYIAALEALMEPERVIQFRVPWIDDCGQLQVNRGFRVQYNSAIGPYKGGMRLHPSVSLSVLKFLGFEQVLKNSLTGLPMGGAKGGSDFDPKGKSGTEVRAFCQSLMTEMCKHIGPNTDVPAGDIGVGAREIGFLYGQYRKITNEVTGVLTGKSLGWGGSLVRPEATGYGAVYFAEKMLENLEGKRCLVSGSGNAAQYTAEKLIQLGAKVITLSDSNGTCVYKNGMTMTQLESVKKLKQVERGRLSEIKENEPEVEYHPNAKPWGLANADLAFPAATQNEIDGDDAKLLANAGVIAVIEVANMPSTADAIRIYKEAKIAYAPGKAANAGGVAVSGMEMAQNSTRASWTFEQVDAELKKVMEHIYNACKTTAEKYGCPGDLQAGANMAGFLKVADAMIDQGMF